MFLLSEEDAAAVEALLAKHVAQASADNDELAPILERMRRQRTFVARARSCEASSSGRDTIASTREGDAGPESYRTSRVRPSLSITASISSPSPTPSCSSPATPACQTFPAHDPVLVIQPHRPSPVPVVAHKIYDVDDDDGVLPAAAALPSPPPHEERLFIRISREQIQRAVSATNNSSGNSVVNDDGGDSAADPNIQ
ncbi:hypothetical protein BD626DRAFT_575471 [Schizophyllum amplum]|uniref:Uncharacterized protein n=1 Tax=Schizophyllum amplum TaxID=97359 RepID=A0A550BVP1_9AGAR|nr:hypothetical protein BD626DRAFT_575471 [Auriculariopsis ampla]